MFAATKDEDGTHRISVRRIRTVRTFHDVNNVPVQIKFTSRAKAKECADWLNTTNYTDLFEERTGAFKGSESQRDEANALMLTVIEKITNEYNAADYGTTVSQENT